MRFIKLLLLCLLLGGVVNSWGNNVSEKPAVAVTSATATSPAEAVLGKKVAEQVEKDYKLVDDEKLLARINHIASILAPFTQRPDVQYTCKILDSKEINAMAIPGGIIYITSGLMQAVESDDELAGVVAHEMAHNSLYHIKRKAEQEKGHTLAQLLAVISMAYVVNNSDMGNGVLGDIIVASELTKRAILNGYSKDFEAEADTNAVAYMVKSGKYDPTGLYSVILGFRQMESGHAPQDMGYLETHPKPEARMALIKRVMNEDKLTVNLWSVVDFRAKVVPPEEGKEGYTVELGTVNIVTFLAEIAGKSPETRAAEAVAAINARLTRPDERIQRIDIDVMPDDYLGSADIYLRETRVMSFYPADASAAGFRTPEALGAMVKTNIQQAIATESLKRQLRPSD